jgi:hypothetical protein
MSTTYSTNIFICVPFSYRPLGLPLASVIRMTCNYSELAWSYYTSYQTTWRHISAVSAVSLPPPSFHAVTCRPDGMQLHKPHYPFPLPRSSTFFHGHCTLSTEQTDARHSVSLSVRRYSPFHLIHSSNSSFPYRSRSYHQSPPLHHSPIIA